jgi:hypothetical protein
MSSDWMREHKETIASKGGAPMAWCLCCLQGERKCRCRFVNVTGRFPISSDWMREHNERNANKGGASMVGCWCCLKSERKR